MSLKTEDKKILDDLLAEMEAAESYHNLDLASNEFMDMVFKSSLSSDITIPLLEKESEVYHRKSDEIKNKLIELNRRIQRGEY